MIRDTARAFLADVADSAALRAMLAPGADAAGLWSRVVEGMGWQALTVPEAAGGLGLGFVELSIVLEAAGARLLPSPLLATVGAGVSVLRCCASEAQQACDLPAVAEGARTLAVGLQSPGGAWGAEGCGLRYRAGAGGFRLDGVVAYVIDGADADALLLVALDESSPSPESARVFRVPADSPGLSRRLTPGMDLSRRLASLRLDGVHVDAGQLLVGSSDGWAQIGAAMDLATIALAAELLGAAQESLDLAVTYTLDREQFGRPVAGFQAIKHKAADMMLRCECARSALYYAACVADGYLAGHASPGALAEAASIAKVSCGDAAFRNAGEALQMHGGVGFTWEYDVHLYFKRARAGRALCGNSDWHRARLAGLIIDSPSEEVAQ